MRICPICGCDMTARSPLAATCSSRCRREKARVLAIVSGHGDPPYLHLAAYLARARREPVQSVWEKLR